MELPVNPVISSMEIATRLTQLNGKPEKEVQKGLHILLRDCIHSIVEYEHRTKQLKEALALIQEILK